MVNERIDPNFDENLWTGLILSNTDFGKINEIALQQQLSLGVTIRDWVKFTSEGMPTTEDQWNSLKHNLELWWKEIFQREYISHQFAIFARDYLPIVTYLGFLIRDTTPTKLFQYQRIENSWKWSENSAIQPQLVATRLNPSTNSKEIEIAVSVSISAKIDPTEIYEVIPSTIPIVEIYLEDPSRDWLKSENQVIAAKKLILKTLDMILQKKRALKVIHLFTACPTSIAFIIGSLINPLMFPTIQTYNYHRKEAPPYKRAIRFNDELKTTPFFRQHATEQSSYVSFNRSAFEQSVTNKELVEIIQNEGVRGETPYFEFKRELNPKKDVETAEIVMSFANADSGILFYGWDEVHKEFCDIDPEVIEQRIIQWTENLIRPSIPIETKILCHPKGRGLLILIPAVEHLVSVNNKIKIRRGSHKVSLSGPTLTRAIKTRQNRPLGHLYLKYLLVRRET